MDKIILITGANKGIGFALAENLLKNGCFVIGTSRNGEISNIKNENLYNLKLDLADNKSIEKASSELTKKFSRIDVLINNAGVGLDLYTQRPNIKLFQETFNINVTGTVFFTESILSLIPKGGTVFNMSSKMGSIELCKLTDSIAYRMSKSALNMYTKILSNRLKGEINVLSIHPGWVKTSIIESNLKNGRLTPKQSAENIMRFLESDYSNNMFWDSENEEELKW